MSDWVADAAARWPSRPAIAREGRVWTYAEIERETRPPGVRKGGVLATWAPPDADHLILLLRALRAGAAIAPLNHRWPRALAEKTAARLGADRLATAEGFIALQPSARTLPEGPATLLMTSGSSGTPRAILHAPEAHLASARASAQRIPLAPGDRWLLALPLAHVSGLAIVFRCFTGGACVSFVADDATHVSLVPTQLARSVGSPPPGLRAALVGGAATSPALAASAVRAGWPLHLTYGLTEAASQVCTTARLGPDGPFHTVGHPLSGTELRAPEGIIEIRGPSLARGVWNGGLEPLTDSSGWFRTSDLGSRGSDGQWRILGRADRVIVSGGENISPEPVERALEDLPGIERAIIVGIPDPEYGARPIAFVRGQPPPGWRSHLAASLPKFSLPDDIRPLPDHIAPGDAKPSLAELQDLVELRSRTPE